MNDRQFPARPILAVSAAVFRQGGCSSCAGRGCRCSAISACPAASSGRRNARGRGRARGYEEVSVEAEIIAFDPHVKAIVHERNRIRTHFVIASFVARLIRGEPPLSDEVDAVDWIDPAAGLPSPTTPELGEILARAARIESQTAFVKK
jgi:8-oxo-dGTP diphosphatase